MNELELLRFGCLQGTELITATGFSNIARRLFD